jgi:putative FmdB family regulatory protein
MPLYEYVCRDCGRRFEVLQRIGADGASLTCPGCGGAKVVKQFSTFASASTSGSTMPCGAASASSCGSGGFS